MEITEDEHLRPTLAELFASLIAATVQQDNDAGPKNRDACSCKEPRVEVRGLFSKLAPRLRRALMVVRSARRRPIRGQGRPCREVRQVVQPSERRLVAAEGRYADGAKLRDLAPELGVSRVRLADLLRQRGVRIRNASPTPAEVAEMVRRYASGESLDQIGERLGFSGGTVRSHLAVCGVATRDTHGRPR